MTGPGRPGGFLRRRGLGGGLRVFNDLDRGGTGSPMLSAQFPETAVSQSLCIENSLYPKTHVHTYLGLLRRPHAPRRRGERGVRDRSDWWALVALSWGSTCRSSRAFSPSPSVPRVGWGGLRKCSGGGCWDPLCSRFWLRTRPLSPVDQLRCPPWQSHERPVFLWPPSWPAPSRPP